MHSWKKLALLATLAAVALLLTPAPEIAVAPEATSAGIRLTTFSATALAQPGPLPIPFCGDLCWTPGQERGCIDASTGVWRRVFCTCSGGSWVC